jgi:hypothetical protein
VNTIHRAYILFEGIAFQEATMFPAYAAVLRDGRLEWESQPPPLPDDVPVRVQVTFLEPTPAMDSGRRAADALDRLAQAGGLSSFGDPVEWQRDVRADRPLPGRDP